MTGFAVSERQAAERRLRASEERQAFLLALGDRMRAESGADAIVAAAAGMLGEHLRASRIVFAEIDEVADVARIRPGRTAAGAQLHPAELRLADFGGPLLDELRAGHAIRFDDVGEPPFAPADQAALHAIGVKAGISVPLIVGGRLVMNLNVHQHDPRRWTDDEVALVREVAERLWPALERARSEAAVRAGERRLALAFRTLPVGIAIIAGGGELVTANEEMRRFLPTGRIPSRDPERSGRWQGWDADGRIVPPQDFPGARALRGDVVSPGLQMLYRDDDGAETWAEVLATPLRDADGRIDGAITVVVDVNRAKRSEEAARASEDRLRQFGEASQDILWIRDTATLQWAYLTSAFETIYGLSRDQALAGDNYRNWREMIVTEDRDHALAAIERVRAGERVNFEYRIRRPSDGAIRWLRNTDFPIADEAGGFTLIGGIGHDFTEAREAELRFQTLVEGLPLLVWRAVDGGEWTWASPQWIACTGQHEADYRDWGWLAALHPDDRDEAREAWSHAPEQGGFEVEYRIRRQADGEYRWFQTRAAPVRDPAGAIIEWLGTSTDIHDLRELQERQHVLVAELQHRTRNLMGVVRSMADKTVRSSADLPDFRARFRDRLEALARVQGLLSRINDHDRVTFNELLDAELSAMDGGVDRVVVDGPAGVRLRSSTVQTLAMALHELATNAVKYGALGQPAGRLAITWRLERPKADERPWLHIEWRESGVAMPPADAAPSGGGQGRELIERALPYQLRARTTYLLGPDGVRCTIAIPVSASTAGTGADA